VNNEHTLIFYSKIDNIVEVENLVESLLDQNEISEVVYGNLIVALTEAALNAIKHGNLSDPNKTVTSTYLITESEISFEIQDQGKGFDYNNLPDPTDPKNIEKENGRGIFIIHNLADKVEFEQGGSKMTISFSLNLKEEVEA
jgi:serine/threonine-protein kinase RsbW